MESDYWVAPFENSHFKLHSLLSYSCFFIIVKLFSDNVRSFQFLFLFYIYANIMYAIIAFLKYCNYDSYKMKNKNIFSHFYSIYSFSVIRNLQNCLSMYFRRRKSIELAHSRVALFKVRRINAPRRHGKPDSGEFIVERYKSERAI